MPKIFPAALMTAFLGAMAPGFAQSFDDNASITSPGGKKIISALLDGQKVLEAHQVPLGKKSELDESDITAMRSRTGWGNVFKQLKLEGRYPTYKNLGQLISSFNRLERASHARSNDLQRTSKGAIRPDRPEKPTRIEKVDRPMRPHRPDKPNRR